MPYKKCLIALLLTCGLASASNYPSGFTESVLAANLVSPTGMDIAPDGRVFFCEQNGNLRVIKNDQLLATPFSTVTTQFQLDRGLLSVAIDPSFATNQFVYVLYTTLNYPQYNRVTRFTANGDVAVAGSETVIFNLTQLVNQAHCDASIKFGPDGKLYIGVGDNADNNNAQSLATMMGKMLRINKDGSIPTDNPYYNQATGNNRAIWAMGLRNPFTFDFQRTTGRMIINEVGWQNYDELDEGVAGANYGWPYIDGVGNNPSYRDPIFTIAQWGTRPGSALTGGVFYNPVTNQFPASYVNGYFYIDYAQHWLRWVNLTTLVDSDFGTNLPLNNLSLRLSNDGSLYYLSRGASNNTGTLMQVQYSQSTPPTITQHPASQSVNVGQSASFAVSASGSAPFTYQWQRNSVNITGANAAQYSISSAQLSDNGATFRCVVSNPYGSATSNSATLTVLQNQPPTATIITPASGTLYIAGQSLSYSGSGSDPEDGTLPASAFTWQVDQGLNNMRDFLPAWSGVTSGSVLIPDRGPQPEAGVFYRFILTVVDSKGSTNTVTRDIYGHVVNVTLATNPPGLQLALDGMPGTAPINFSGVSGFRRTISAAQSQIIGADTYDFVGWSDQGAATHEIVTPMTNTVYTANYVKRGGQPLSIISLTASPSSPAVGEQVTFTASVAGGTAPLQWRWYFGDNQAAYTPNMATHTYTKSGTVLVTLVVNDAAGQSAYRQTRVYVKRASTTSTTSTTSSRALNTKKQRWRFRLRRR